MNETNETPAFRVQVDIVIDPRATYGPIDSPLPLRPDNGDPHVRAAVFDWVSALLTDNNEVFDWQYAQAALLGRFHDMTLEERTKIIDRLYAEEIFLSVEDYEEGDAFKEVSR